MNKALIILLSIFSASIMMSSNAYPLPIRDIRALDLYADNNHVEFYPGDKLIVSYNYASLQPYPTEIAFISHHMNYPCINVGDLRWYPGMESIYSRRPAPAPVPEPLSFILLGTGLIGIGLAGKHRVKT
jgi:hypothetical protein